MTRPIPLVLLSLPALLLAGGHALAQGGNSLVYKCPGPPIEYTDRLTPQEAKVKHCVTIANAPVTIVQSPKPRLAPGNGAASAPRPAESRVDAGEQRARDSDARKILDSELKREEEKLAALQKEYNNGEPERKGDERNYQRFLDRVEELKSAIARKQSDLAAIKRELGKLPPAKE